MITKSRFQKVRAVLLLLTIAMIGVGYLGHHLFENSQIASLFPIVTAISLGIFLPPLIGMMRGYEAYSHSLEVQENLGKSTSPSSANAVANWSLLTKAVLLLFSLFLLIVLFVFNHAQGLQWPSILVAGTLVFFMGYILRHLKRRTPD